MLKTAVTLAVGYVLGAKAGRERYERITELADRAATALEQRSRQQQARASSKTR